MNHPVWPSLSGRDEVLAVGLMSGTSMDGVDAAVVSMDLTPVRPRVELRAFISNPYPDELRESLLDAAAGAQVTAEDMAAMHTGVAVAFAGAFFAACREGHADTHGVDFIGSHGQTVAHIPPGSGAAVAGTLQLGPPAMIAALTGVTTVGDFRCADVAIGGQGAPLAPYCDYMLRRGETTARVILNIGGIANLTYLPRGGSPEDVIALDAGPGNMVTDALFRALFPGEGHYDEDGVRAAAGNPSKDICDELMRHPFFRSGLPRSAGHREFGPAFAWMLKRAADAAILSPEDTLATSVLLTARGIEDAVRRFLPEAGVDEIFVTGGGARNLALMRELQRALDGVAIAPIDELGIPAEAKEAVDFAFLAREALLGRTNVMRSVTGASRALVLGSICRG
ncbi:MAG TPA: anhydro-N-acetylmuramic acid kinase [Candidatus Krumholzibacteria bacterium]|nr:anhydro-N-acetylmuramic acid kinase [Candidatus Krumholzibacteria bacterium]